MSDEVHEWRLLSPVTLRLNSAAFIEIHHEYEAAYRDMNLDPPPPTPEQPFTLSLPKAEDILSAVLNRLARAPRKENE